MRNAFVGQLTSLAEEDPKIFLLSGDLGFSVLESFAKRFPKQFLNCGVAEQNMLGMAAGLAMGGRTVFVYSITPFVTMRVYEQLRNDICYQNLNVKVVSVGSGLSYGQLGPTHHAIEDVTITRVLPNLTVISPADPVEAVFMTRAVADINGPVYLRLGKGREENIYPYGQKFVVGKGILLRDGSDVLIFTAGAILKNVIDAARRLENQGISAAVISLSTIKPLDKEIIKTFSRHFSAAATVEEHSTEGGLGDAVASCLLEGNCGISTYKRIGIADRFVTEVGNQDYLREVSGLSVDKIADQISAMLKRRLI